VVKRFGSTTALAGVDLEVPEGMDGDQRELLALTGRFAAVDELLADRKNLGLMAVFVPLSVWRYRRVS
jgi:hypothetical protein